MGACAHVLTACARMQPGVLLAGMAQLCAFFAATSLVVCRAQAQPGARMGTGLGMLDRLRAHGLSAGTTSSTCRWTR